MMPFSLRTTVIQALLILGAIVTMVLIVWMALHLTDAQLDGFEPPRMKSPYFVYWRALLYTLIFAGWTAVLRLRPAPEEQQRLMRLGLIGFGSIILVELSRM
ncbi:hypothetical protein D3C76_1363480 [compost metagenome]|uniref:hypothetical protein n=1 Tax=Pseudomonas putida TaxID=303 RepID=UPI000F99A567